MMGKPHQHQISENPRKSRSSFKKNMRRSDGKIPLEIKSLHNKEPLFDLPLNYQSQNKVKVTGSVVAEGTGSIPGPVHRGRVAKGHPV